MSKDWQPAPWEWGNDWYDRDDLFPVWTMGMSQGQGFIDWADEKKMAAHRNLIRAAPDMYAALETAEECIVTVIGAFGATIPHEILTEIRDAMAKARGEEE